MFLFILESIGTSELILIGIIALIFLGPRKLPEIARKIGKTMADFRNTTNEFKSTWEREVNFEEEATALRTGDLAPTQPTIARTDTVPGIPSGDLAPPSIKPAQPDLFVDPPTAGIQYQPETADSPVDDGSDKRNWL